MEILYVNVNGLVVYGKEQKLKHKIRKKNYCYSKAEGTYYKGKIWLNLSRGVNDSKEGKEDKGGGELALLIRDIFMLQETLVDAPSKEYIMYRITVRKTCIVVLLIYNLPWNAMIQNNYSSKQQRNYQNGAGSREKCTPQMAKF